MVGDSFKIRRWWEGLAREELERNQLTRLNALLATILPGNRFYAERLGDLQLPLMSLRQLTDLPYTFKEDLVSRAHSDTPGNRTYPVTHYVRFHRTSGTHGHPLPVLDTADDWQWWIETWQFVLDAAELSCRDRVLMAFSFGPFIGFWSATDAVIARGAMIIPAGGLDSTARLELIEASRATVLCCTPTYALRLAEVAAEQQIDLAANHVTRIIVAGEPGGSVPEIRQRIESSWNARVVDHSGATEVGPWGYPDERGQGLHIVESEFLAEFRGLQSEGAADEGELSELVLTTLGRCGCPVIRYRTGDLVRPHWQLAGPNRFVWLEGGVLGRVDDMLIIRGVNVFPSSIEQILHGFPEVVEYRLTADRQGTLDTLSVEVEDRLQEPARIARELKLRLGLHVPVRSVPVGSLPRFEGKAARFVDQRKQAATQAAGSQPHG